MPQNDDPATSDPGLEHLWQALQEAQATMQAQAARIEALESRLSPTPGDAGSARISRAGLLKAAAAGAAALAGAGALGAQQTMADGSTWEYAKGVSAVGNFLAFQTSQVAGFETPAAVHSGIQYGVDVEGTTVGVRANVPGTAEYAVEAIATGGAIAVSAFTDGSAAGVQTHSGTGIGLQSTADGNEAVHGESSWTDANAAAVHGILTVVNSGANAAAVWGENQGLNNQGSGVYGSHASAGIGVSGHSVGGTGVQGDGGAGIGVNAISTGTAALQASNSASSDGAAGVYAKLTSHSPGNLAAAVRAQADSTSANGYGLYATHAGTGHAVYGLTRFGAGVEGRSNAVTGPSPSTGIGVSGNSDAGIGVLGVAGINTYAAGGGYGGQFAIAGTGLAQLSLVPAATTGHPSKYTHQAGEIYMDAQCNLFVCVAQGNPGTWKQILYNSGPTIARVTHFTATRHGPATRFDWRVGRGTGGIVGFELYGGGRRLNGDSIPPHTGRDYRRTFRHAGNGPFVLHVVMSDGQVLAVHAR